MAAIVVLAKQKGRFVNVHNFFCFLCLMKTVSGGRKKLLSWKLHLEELISMGMEK